MKNRSLYAILTRFGILGALLATLAFIAPVVFANALTFSYAENGTDAVATFSASDPDADAGDIAWSLGGVDAGIFKIDGGVLTFDKSPDFEDAKDSDEIDDTISAGPQGAGDNVYKVTVIASGGEQDVEVTVTDVDEPGKVTIDQPQPQATRSLEASGPGDPDGGVDEMSWQWSRGPSAEGPWTEIAGATSARRTPGTADIDNYLQATVTYVDVHGDQSVSGVTDNPVEPRTLANAAPKFDDVDAIPVPEGKSGKIGEPIAASDGDNDELLYDVDTATTTEDQNDNALFSVDNNGQLSLTDAQNFEADPTTSTTNEASTTDIVEYTVVLRATDPSRASASVTVMVHLTNVNEAAEFQAPSKDQKTLYIAEDGTTPAEGPPIFQNDGLTTAVVAYDADDEDGGADTVTYSLEGADKASFAIDGTNGELTTLQAAPGTTPPTAGLKANFESKSSYSIIIVAESTDADTTNDDDRGTKYTRLDVTVMVVDREDTGTVTLSARQSQEAISVVATHSDADDGVTDRMWQWYRGGTALPDTLSTLLDSDGKLLATTACVVDDANTPDTDERTAADTLCRIDGETAALYTPGSNDVDRLLHVVADYKDDFDADTREQAGKSSDATVQASNPANTAPAFPDQDLSTPGDQSAMAMRTVAENVKDMVGQPIPAGDADRNSPEGNEELLTYTIDDTDNFSVNQANGQISTAVKLDYESLPEDAKYYMVTLTATDPSGSSDSIMVQINVTDADDPAVITGDATFSYAENGTDAVATFSASDPDADAGDIAWSLGGVDKGIFKIDGGVLTFDKSPDFEDAKDSDEIADSVAAGPQGAGDNVYKVTVMASGGEQDVEVTVTDVDEPGKVTIDQPQPQATRSLEASGPGDPDGGVDEMSWQWSRGPSAEGPWTEIAGATSARRTPGTADIDNYLQATVTYVDVHGDQSVSGVTDNPVEGRTLANAAPKFDDVDAIPVPEGKSGKIGEPIAASDGDNDELLYDVDTVGTTDDPNDNTLFSVDNNGQLSLTDALDYETPGTGKEVNSAGTGIEYTVVLRATDPSRASGTVTVTVLLTNVNEAAEFQAPSKDQTTLYIAEDGTTPAEGTAIFQNDGLTTAVVDYDAEDQDGSADTVTYSLEGADKASFSITDAGALTTLQAVTGATSADGLKANFESKSSYSIIIVAESTDADTTNDEDRGTKYTRLDVTVMVVDREDTGDVTLSARQSQEAISVVATHSDADDGVTDRMWQWYRGGALPGTLSTLLDSDGKLLETAVCEVDDPDDPADAATTGAETLCRIDGETAPIYTPGSDDVGRVLHVVADYKDDFNADTREQAGKSSDATVQASNPANTAPAFPDQDLSTPGDQSDMAMRSVAENVKGMVGQPIPAGDADRGVPEGNEELLTYKIDDTDNFSVNQANGQISTAVELDYESLPEGAKYYMVTLTAIDPSGAYDTIMVQINVTDADDKAVITVVPVENVMPEFDAETAEFMVYENMYAGEAVGTVTASDPGDTLTYTDNSDYFDVDGDGNITTTMMLDHEAMASHTVMITATDSEGASDSIVVTVTVGNSQPGCDGVNGMGLVNDCEALLDAKDTLDPDGSLLNWTDHTHTPITEWTGVSILDGRVSAINLRGVGLEGELSPALGRLSMVTHLNIDRNEDLTGEIPAALGYLGNLTVLNLHSNGHTGMIPDLSGASMLEELYLPANSLEGEIPMWLNGMTNMTELWLWGNDLSGSVPDLSGMTSLDKLKLADNDLTGGLPTAAMLPPNVTWLIIDRNDFGGTIPDLSSLTSLRLLWLHSNGLTGAVPSGDMLPTSLDDLNLRDNMLMGEIPDLSALINLTRLRLHNNSLSGVVPGTLGGLESLTSLWLHNEDSSMYGNNAFTGIDAGLAGLADTLTHLYLDGNNFADGTCLPGELASVANNDFADAGLAACAADDGS